LSLTQIFGPKSGDVASLIEFINKLGLFHIIKFYATSTKTYHINFWVKNPTI